MNLTELKKVLDETKVYLEAIQSEMFENKCISDNILEESLYVYEIICNLLEEMNELELQAIFQGSEYVSFPRY